MMSIPENKNPIELFKDWLVEAEAMEPLNANAMALATSNAENQPSVRMVLLKDVDEKGFVFYSNAESRKGQEIDANAHVSLCFYWKSLGRQVRIDGSVSQVSNQEADAYFDSRHLGSRIGAWASSQSRPMEEQFDLEKNVAKYAAKYKDGSVPRPDYWCGYRVAPDTIEFWIEQESRLHDRFVYRRSEKIWDIVRLFP
jgi:pyridoxamine 5'-phosphate oxidase